MDTGGSYLVTPVGSQRIFTREEFSSEQRDIAAMVDEFVSGRITPNREAIEKHDKELSLSLLRECGELGLLGIEVPERYGGMDLDMITATLVAEHITKGGSASFTVTFSVQVGIGMLPIVYFGNEDQRQKYLPKLVSGEWVSAYALTEPEAGSDALNASSTAKLSEDGKHYILNGTKQFISNGAWADVYIVFAKIDSEKFTAFIVDRSAEGVHPGAEEHKMGIKGSSTTSLTLDNVHVPVGNVLHEIGKGHEVAFNILDIGRFKLGAADLGGCKTCVDEAVSYALDRRQFGQPIANFEVIQRYFADMVIRAFAVDSIIYRTGGLIEAAIDELDPASPDYHRDVRRSIERYAIEASICKIYGSEGLWFNSDTGLQIFGGYGFIEDYALAGIVRDTRVDRIYEGTNEINRQIITGYFLRKALMEELPVRDRVKELPKYFAGDAPHVPSKDDPLSEEKRAVELAKALTLFAFNEAVCEFGQDLRNQQQVGEVLSNLFIDVFVLDSTLSRVAQYTDKNGPDRTWLAIPQVLIAERVDEMAASIRRLLCGIHTGVSLKKALENLQTLTDRMLLNTNVFELKRFIAEDLYEKRRYRF
jgi:alkylation response protein AidB-like acyl-CoA dehydrogenase